MAQAAAQVKLVPAPQANLEEFGCHFGDCPRQKMPKKDALVPYAQALIQAVLKQDGKGSRFVTPDELLAALPKHTFCADHVDEIKKRGGSKLELRFHPYNQVESKLVDQIAYRNEADRLAELYGVSVESGNGHVRK